MKNIYGFLHKAFLLKRRPLSLQNFCLKLVENIGMDMRTPKQVVTICGFGRRLTKTFCTILLPTYEKQKVNISGLCLQHALLAFSNECSTFRLMLWLERCWQLEMDPVFDWLHRLPPSDSETNSCRGETKCLLPLIPAWSDSAFEDRTKRKFLKGNT